MNTTDQPISSSLRKNSFNVQAWIDVCLFANTVMYLSAMNISVERVADVVRALFIIIEENIPADVQRFVLPSEAATYLRDKHLISQQASVHKVREISKHITLQHKIESIMPNGDLKTMLDIEKRKSEALSVLEEKLGNTHTHVD